MIVVQVVKGGEHFSIWADDPNFEQIQPCASNSLFKIFQVICGMALGEKIIQLKPPNPKIQILSVSPEQHH